MNPRPLKHLHDLSARYPGAWPLLERLRAERGKKMPEWPQHVYLPVAAALAVVTGGAPKGSPAFADALANVQDVGSVAALGAWRMTKGVYRFDPDILGALWDTPLTGDLPSELLARLPEWCVYVETPGRALLGEPVHGFYAHLEHDPNDHRRELRLLIDYDAGLSPLPVHLGGSILGGLEEMARASEASAAEYGRDVTGLSAVLERQRGALGSYAEAIQPLVSLLLYLCSERPDIAGDGVPGNPKPKRVKGGPRLFASPKVKTWDVAYRLGAAFRQARSEASGEGGGEGGRTVRAHVRRAHWHLYRVGRGRQESVLKWLPPIPVAFGGDELPAVVRRVRDEGR